jgi:hypothetical protein
MQPQRTSAHDAPENYSSVLAKMDRPAGLITLVGCSCTILAAFTPWLEDLVFRVSVVEMRIPGVGIVLAVLAVISGGIAVGVLLRRPAPAGVAVILVASAIVQVGLAIWGGADVLRAIGNADSHLVPMRAIGTGAYIAVLGSLTTLAGGILAWKRRAPPSSLRHPSELELPVRSQARGVPGRPQRPG